jgi:hypothetical protein
MDFSKLAAQRAAKEQQTPETPAASTDAAKAPRRQGRITSKRQGWKAATFYIRPQTLAQLRRVVGLRKLEGGTADLSDAVEEALQAWLEKAEKVSTDSKSDSNTWKDLRRHK